MALPALKGLQLLRFSCNAATKFTNSSKNIISGPSVLCNRLFQVRENYPFEEIGHCMPLSFDGETPTTNPLASRKKPLRIRKPQTEEASNLVRFPIEAYSTAEKYDMASLHKALHVTGRYIELPLPANVETDMIHVTVKHETGNEPQDMYFLSDGTVVFWNIPEEAQKEVLKFLKSFEEYPYEEELVAERGEYLEYSYSDGNRLSAGTIFFIEDDRYELQCYVLSRIIAQSAKLSAWEASLQSHFQCVQSLSRDIASGNKTKLYLEDLFVRRWRLYTLKDAVYMKKDSLQSAPYCHGSNLEKICYDVHEYLLISRRAVLLVSGLTHCMEPIEQLIKNA